jgi:oligopeptidase A
MNNPLLEPFILPPFSRIEPGQVQPAVGAVLAANREAIAALLASRTEFDWDSLVETLDELDDRLGKLWSPVSHLNAVMNTDELRAAYNACLPELSEYSTELGQNQALYQAWQSLAHSPEYGRLSSAQQKVIDNALRDFRLSGISLPPDQQARYKALAAELSRLSSQFQDHVLDATQAFTRLITDESLLSGIPDSARAAARQAATTKNSDGWLFTLEFPSWIAIMTYADDRSLRQDFYTAHVTRASDQGPHAGQFDNSGIMENILARRHEQARLLGFANYAEESIATKMARSTDEVTDFLLDLARRSLPHARKDLETLQHFARDEYGLDDLQAWDIPYYSEKLRQKLYAFSEEEVRAYFPAPHVMQGLFTLLNRLYGLEIRQETGVDVWHPDVVFYRILDQTGEVRGFLYVDLYARANKRGGAWMDDCVTRRHRQNHPVQHPVAYVVCNFTPPMPDHPALLRHGEVETLFHEFGHALHHLLTRMDHLAVSGIRGVEWDAVELPSQFMENFCWEPEPLALLTRHHQSGDPLPKVLLDKMLAARNFQAGLQTVRQLEFALFDFRLHKEYDPATGGRVYAVLDAVRQQVAAVIPPSFNRFPHSFSHIFAGGYAAGYYSYKWAEVLSSDAYSLFEERGVLDPATGKAFLENILEQGGGRDAMTSFVAFRGREPTLDALLRHSGMTEAA